MDCCTSLLCIAILYCTLLREKKKRWCDTACPLWPVSINSKNCSTFFSTIQYSTIMCYLCVFSSHSFWTSSSLDVSAGVTQEEGHTGFFIHLPSAVRAFIFLARRIQPFLSLVDRQVDFLCTNDLIVLHSLGIYNPVYRDRTHVPTCQKVTRIIPPIPVPSPLPEKTTFISSSLIIYYFKEKSERI